MFLWLITDTFILVPNYDIAVTVFSVFLCMFGN